MDFNSSFGNSTAPAQRFSVPGFITFSGIVFAGVIIPLATLDSLILVTIFINKRAPFQIRLVMGNMMVLGLVTLLFLTLEHLTVFVLVAIDSPVPPPHLCSFITWLLFSASSTRILLTAAFSIVVYIMIVKGVKAVKKIPLLVSLIFMWITGFCTITLPILITSSNNFYAAQVACTPTEFEETIMNRVVAGLYVTGLKVIPIVISISMSIASGVFLYKHRHSDRSKKDFLTAMAKLAAFLIFGSVANFSGHTLPIFIGKAFPSLSKVATFYIFFTLYNLSLWPTPILIMVYMRKSYSFTLPCKRNNACAPKKNTTTAPYSRGTVACKVLSI